MLQQLLSSETLEKNADVLKAIAHPVRLCIVIGLVENGACNVSYMQSCLEMPQSTVSQHLAKLKSAGVIKGERHGTEIVYGVENPLVIEIVQSILKESTK